MSNRDYKKLYERLNERLNQSEEARIREREQERRQAEQTQRELQETKRKLQEAEQTQRELQKETKRKLQEAEQTQRELQKETKRKLQEAQRQVEETKRKAQQDLIEMQNRTEVQLEEMRNTLRSARGSHRAVQLLHKPIAPNVPDTRNPPQSSRVTATGIIPIQIKEWSNVCADLRIIDPVFDANLKSPSDIFFAQSIPDEFPINEIEYLIRRYVDKHSTVGIEELFRREGRVTVLTKPERPTLVNSRIDIVWYINDVAKLPEEFKRPTNCPVGDIRRDLWDQITGWNDDGTHSWPHGEKRNMDVISQIFSYMVFLKLKYGMISTGERLWLLKRDTTGTLWISKAFFCFTEGIESINNVKAAMLKLVDSDTESSSYPIDEDSPLYRHILNFYVYGFSLGQHQGIAEPPNTDDIIQARMQKLQNIASHLRHGNTQALRDMLPLKRDEFMMALPWNRTYQILHDQSSTHVARMKVGDLDLVVKTLIITDEEDHIEANLRFNNEISTYMGMKSIQGDATPWMLYAGEFGDGRNIIALTYEGHTLQDTSHYNNAMISLSKIHSCGFAHGDVEMRNMTFTEDGNVKIIDFGFAYPHLGDQKILDQEMQHLRYIFT